MTTLTDLTEQSILGNLRTRYEAQFIYTYTGSILVALNPYKALPIYDKEMVRKYTGRRLGELPPHIFAVSETAFNNCRQFKQNQAMIISGESGAGKTESTKVILQYLTMATAQAGDDSKSWIEQQILEANTVLESFGNAKTVRNNNSSRFGKFVQVLFGSNFQIIGASIVNYLLEKSRVVRQAPSERNYHIFYEMLAGATGEERIKYNLTGAAKDYNFLNSSGCIEIPNVNDKKNFEDLKLALTVLKMSKDDMDSTLRAVASILHLGNLQFKVNEAKDCVSIVGKDDETLNMISELLQVDKGKFSVALCNRRITVRNESTFVPLKKDQAFDNRDSIAKTIYDKLFNFIVTFINASTATRETTSNFIGVLDIFGFELFEVNSFEQLCINYTNEKLQQFFNQFIFKLEQEEYGREGISFESISYKDNQPCLDLIESKPGVLLLLDEECKVPKGTDDTFLTKLHDTMAKNEYYVKPKLAKGCFGIKHYAGEVTYQVANFLDKNRDAVQDEIYELFEASKVEMLQKLFKRSSDANEKSGKKTAGSNFKAQLSALVTTLGTTAPHYVRCVKPNWEKQAFVFDETLVIGLLIGFKFAQTMIRRIAQLRYSGMLETIRIRKSGFPTRFPYDVFNYRFRYMITGSNSDPKQIAGTILKTSKIEQALWQFGNTKVFMKQKAYDMLVDSNDKIRTRLVIIVQKLARCRLCRKKYLKIRKAATHLQKYLKMFVYRERYKKIKKSALKIQSVIRGWFARDYVKQLKAEKKAAEEAAERERIEAEKRALEAAKASSDAAARALAAERLREIEEEKKMMEKRRQEEESVADYAAHVHKEKPADGLDNLFSFLGDFDGKANAEAAKNVPASAFDDIFKLDLASDTKKGNDENTIANFKANNGSKTEIAPEKPKAMKFNPLAKAMAQAAEDVVQEEKGDFSIKAFAEKYFDRHPKAKSGTFKNTFKKSKDAAASTHTLEEMICYSKLAALPSTIIKLPPTMNPILTEFALEVWRHINRTMDPAPKKQEEEFALIRRACEIGIGCPEIRDEIYVQLCRQLTPNPNEPMKQWLQMERSGWNLLAIICGSFPPSKVFSKHFLHFLSEAVARDKDTKEGSSEVAKFAQYAEGVVKKLILNGPRKLPPSTMEINAVRTQAPILSRFYLMDGQVKAMGISPATTAVDAIKDVAKRIDLKDVTGWAVYEITDEPWEEHLVRGSEYIADILTFYEMTGRGQDQPAPTPSPEPVKGNRKSSAAPQPVVLPETRLYIKKRVLRSPNEIPADPVEFSLIYGQATVDVMHDCYPMNDKTAVQLAALKMQVEFGNIDATQNNRFNQLKSFFPSSLYGSQTPEKWKKSILEVQEKLSGKTAVQARILYLEALKQFKHYGSTLYFVKYKGFWQHPENIVLAISSSGVLVMTKSKNILEAYAYRQITSWEVDDDVIAFNVLKPASTGKDNSAPVAEKPEVMKFQTRMAEDISGLMKEYSLKIGGERRKDRDLFVPENEIISLQREIEKARAALLKKSMILIPTGKKSVFGSVLRTQKGANKSGSLLPTAGKSGQNLSKKDEDATAAQEQDWMTIMSGIACPILSTYTDNKDALNSAALIYNHILDLSTPERKASTASNASTPSTNSQAESATLQTVQTIFVKTMDFDRILIDELYLQLIKYTTEYGEPDSKPTLQNWKVLAIACSILRPAHPEVLELLKAHLKRYSVIDLKVYPEFWRREEANHAKFCYKALMKTLISDVNRQLPPPIEEIGFTMRMGSVFTRFYTPDGQFRAIGVEPWSSAEEALSLLKEKMKMETVTGLAIYQIVGTTQTLVDPKDKICDILSKWEKLARASGKDRPVTRFLVKKRLFFNTHKPSLIETEEDFVLYQMMDDIMSERFPLAPEDALYLTALNAQMDSGDAIPEKNIKYEDLIERYVPKYLRQDPSLTNLASEHLSNRGKTVADCKRLYMHRLRAWPLFGSTIFEFKQSYTDSIPSICWLAINQLGIYVVKPREKETFFSHTYEQISTSSPNDDGILIGGEADGQPFKYVFETKEAQQISVLIHDYKGEMARTKEEPKK